MTDRKPVAGKVARAALWSAKFILPALAVAAVVIAGVLIKGWPIHPFVQASGPKYDPADWCAEHGVPESLCTLCHPELKEKLLMCAEHGLPESLCTLCHPELAQRFVMCTEHNLPESYCTICNPPAQSADKPDWCAEHGVPQSRCTLCNRTLESPMCAEHGVPESLCTICSPQLAQTIPTCTEHGLPPAFCPRCAQSRALRGAGDPGSVAGVPLLLPRGAESVTLCRLNLPLVKLASPRTAEDAGIEVAPVESRMLDRKVTCNGVADYQQNRFAPVRPRVEGIVREVLVDVGTRVQRGDVLAVVDSATLGEAKADYLSAVALLELAEKNLGRLAGLAARQIVPGKTLIEAETRFTEARVNVSRARQRLENLGLSPSDIEVLEKSQDTSSLLQITAPLQGVVVRRQVAPGEAVEPTSELFAVANLDTMWVHLQLYEDDAQKVRNGQPVTFIVDNATRDAFSGKVTWVSSEVNVQTRTIQVRAEVNNRQGLLRAGMYGTGVIQIEPPSPTQVIPKLAVQWHEGAPVVFVKKGADLFEPRRICVGRKEDSFWEVTAGVKLGELVATTGSFLLKTELKKGAIGAGCCGD